MKNQQVIVRRDFKQASAASTAFVLPFLLITSLQIFLGIFSLAVMTDLRAFTEGESLWSKAQKASVRALNVYAATGREADYQVALNYLNVTRGDHLARLEMDKPEPDYNLIREALVQGHNARSDIDGMIWLYRNFGFFSDMREAVTVWRSGDAELDRLHVLAQNLHTQVAAAPDDAAAIAAMLNPINRLDDTFTELEDHFSQAIGHASAFAQVVLRLAMLLTGLSLLGLSVLYTRRVLAKNLEYQSTLTRNTERYNLALEGSNIGLWDWNVASDKIYCSPWVQRLLGRGDHELMYEASEFVQLIHPDDRARNRRAVDAHLSDGTSYDIEVRLRVADGAYRWCHVLATATRDGAGQPVRMVGSVSDVTERRQQSMALFAEKERAQVTLASIADAVIRTEIDGTVSYLNRAAERLLKWRDGSAYGRPLMQVLRAHYDHNQEPIADPVAQILHCGTEPQEVGADMILARPDGSEVAIDLSIALIHDLSGAPVGTVLVLHDISREREHAEQLQHQATHDELTGLFNRRAFQTVLQNVLKSAAVVPVQHALLYLDLDQFKVVNDTCGHQAGDELIRQISTILKTLLRPCDCFARLGGDEFGIFLANCPPRQAVLTAEQVRQSVAEFRFIWRDKFFSVGVSIGLVNFTAQQFSLAELMSLADVACYVAKEKGRNRVHQHAVDDVDLAARHGEMKWAMRLHDALEQQQFCLYAQPIVDLSGRRPLGEHVEVLVRLLGSLEDVILPTTFLPSAERYNLMPAIDRWVVGETFATLAARPCLRGDVRIKTCAINLSGASIGDPEFLAFIFEQQRKHGVPLALICFEITETVAISNLTDALRFIESLRAHGCRFSLDDFGAGMSSFAYLRHLPVDYLKIDGAFVKDIARDATDYAMVEAINTIGHLMNKRTIAEFVEDRLTLEGLQAIGVDYAQGFVLARPEPFDAGSVARQHEMPPPGQPAPAQRSRASLEKK